MVFVVLALRKLCAAVLLLRGLSSKTPSSRDVCQRLFSGGPAHGDLQLLSSSLSIPDMPREFKIAKGNLNKGRAEMQMQPWQLPMKMHCFM